MVSANAPSDGMCSRRTLAISGRYGACVGRAHLGLPARAGFGADGAAEELNCCCDLCSSAPENSPPAGMSTPAAMNGP